MYDARIFISSLDNANDILKQDGWVYKGTYTIHDTIFASKDTSQDLGKIFLRIRSVPANIWNEKEFIVAIKQTEIMQIGKQSIIPVKEQFDSLNDAQEFVKKNYSDVFEYSYEFDRMGWQYDLHGDQIDLEDIQGHFSIEFKSKTIEGLQKLLDRFGVTEVISGPSVVEIKKLLNL